MNMFLIYIVIIVTSGVEVKLNTSIPAFYDLQSCKEYVMKKVLRMTDNEIDEMQRQINREAGLDPDEGGIDVPQSTDGITRYPSQGGEVLPADDVAKFDGQQVDDEEK